MMMANFTKGEWKAGYNPGVTGPTTPVIGAPFCGGRDWPYRTINVGEETIAIVPAQSDNRIYPGHAGNAIPGSAEANANLVAAAPDMYEALKGLDGYYLMDELRKPIDKALAKADGKQ